MTRNREVVKTATSLFVFAFGLGITRNAAAIWDDYSGAQMSEIAVANVGITVNGVPPSGGIACGVIFQQTNIKCFSAAGSQITPSKTEIFDLPGQWTGSGPVTFNATNTMMSLTIRPVRPNVNGTGAGYWFYVLRKDGAIFATWKPLPLSASTGSFFWEHITTSPSTLVPRQIYWSTSGLMMVGTDNHLYQRVGASWVLSSSASAVAIFGGDDGSFVTLNGTSATSTVLSAVSTESPETPPDLRTIGGLPYGNADPDLAFSVYGRTTPVSCDLFGCYALASSNLADLGRFEPAIYVSGWHIPPPAMRPWTIFNTAQASEFTGGETGPWTIVAAAGYRGIQGDVFVVGGGVHLMEWIPPV